MGTFDKTLLLVFVLLSTSPAFFMNYLQQFDDGNYPQGNTHKVFVQARKEVALITCMRALTAIKSNASNLSLEVYHNTTQILSVIVTVKNVTANNETKEIETLDGNYFEILQKAYHVRVIADDRVPHWVEMAAVLESAEKKAREYYRAVKSVTDAKVNCLPQKEWNPKGSFLKELETLANKNRMLRSLECFDRETVQAAHMEDFEVECLKAYREAMLIFTFSMGVAFHFDTYHVNGRATNYTLKSTLGVEAADAKRLELEIDDNLDEFESRLASAKERGDQKSITYYQHWTNHFNASKWVSPYLWLLNGTSKIRKLITKRRKAFKNGFKATTNADSYYKAYVKSYSKNVESFRKGLGSEGSPMRAYVWFKSQEFFLKHLNVFDRNHNPGEGEHDGGFYYHDELVTGYWFNLKKPLQNARVAQERLDFLNENMKCYLKKNYWQDVRNETLAKMQAQFQTKYIFSRLSQTLYQPCKLSDTDLIGICNVDNHEMCTPALVSREQQKHIDVAEDKTYFKPKWIFWRDETQPETSEARCKGELTYVIPVNLCRCGVRMDCGSDIGEDINCVLMENDEIRKQCLGSIGYPCQSLPLAPGRHHESCVTGYCDMKQNMCEEDLENYPKVN